MKPKAKLILKIVDAAEKKKPLFSSEKERQQLINEGAKKIAAHLKKSK